MSRTSEPRKLMLSFAARTGLDGAGPPRRYLWTDAFAVCNFLGLWRARGDRTFLDHALRLVAQVHDVLGRHRPDDPRSGLISGLSEQEGALHPARGGLRIGKPLRERAPGESVDERLEWQQDGQYFHYLTRWMHALDQVSRATGDAQFVRWAIELGEVAHRRFVYAVRPGLRRMYWKMSIDLSRPLVTSMGQHDPLDGLVTCLQLRATAERLAPECAAVLAPAQLDFAAMLDAGSVATADPLGIGGLLADAYRLWQLKRQGSTLPDPALPDLLLRGARSGLHAALQRALLRGPASRRLGFRELGLAIGLAAAGRMVEGAEGADPRPLAGDLREYLRLREQIEDFWLLAEHRRDPTWIEHADINDVMLATSLSPDGYLELLPPAAA
jgi:hypothetical protein